MSLRSLFVGLSVLSVNFSGPLGFGSPLTNEELEKLSPEIRLAALSETDYLGTSSANGISYAFYRFRQTHTCKRQNPCQDESAKYQSVGEVIEKMKQSFLVRSVEVEESCFANNEEFCQLTVQLK